jgi:4-carboxymuconolactone decarboxylase
MASEGAKESLFAAGAKKDETTGRGILRRRTCQDVARMRWFQSHGSGGPRRRTKTRGRPPLRRRSHDDNFIRPETTSNRSDAMARLDGVQPQNMNEKQRAVADAIIGGPRGRLGALMALWLHSPDLAEPVQEVGSYFRREPAFPRAAVEMIILMTARHWMCEYEWAAHEPVARKEGLADAIIESVRKDERPAFADDKLAAIHAFVAAMLKTHGASDDTVAALERSYGARGVVDASILIGHYIHGAILIQAAGLERPAGTSSPFLPP